VVKGSIHVEKGDVIGDGDLRDVHKFISFYFGTDCNPFSRTTRRVGGQIFVQPLMLPILQVKVLSQELPIYLGSHIRLRRR
jgi:hypothetical protein